MNPYVTGAIIRKLREKKQMTQSELAEKLLVSDKTVSKWETGRGYPDITLLEPLADALGISAIELLSGQDVFNSNRSSNMLRTALYVCPVCGNVICAVGEAVVSCCGIVLPPLEAEEPDDEHPLNVERVEDEWYVTVSHPMRKDHYISFLAVMSNQGLQMVKLYPEGNAQARFKIDRTDSLYGYCNRHGLFKIKIRGCSLKRK